jgi:hypothetical protein
LPVPPPPPPPRRAGPGNGTRLGICTLLCELYLADCIPETVIHDCLEQLLWDVSPSATANAAPLTLD